MDRSDVINLIETLTAQDDHGVWQKTYRSRSVFCQVESVSQREFYEAGRNGLNPSLKFIVFFGDYNNEPTLTYKGQTYAIYRTYQRKDDLLELYCERKGGTNTVASV